MRDILGLVLGVFIIGATGDLGFGGPGVALGTEANSRVTRFWFASCLHYILQCNWWARSKRVRDVTRVRPGITYILCSHVVQISNLVI